MNAAVPVSMIQVTSNFFFIFDWRLQYSAVFIVHSVLSIVCECVLSTCGWLEKPNRTRLMFFCSIFENPSVVANIQF